VQKEIKRGGGRRVEPFFYTLQPQEKGEMKKEKRELPLISP